MCGQCNANRAQQSFRSGVAHELSQDNCQTEKYCSYQVRRRVTAHQAYGKFSNQLASAAGVHSCCNRNHACKQEDGNPVDGVIGLFFSDAACQYAQYRSDNSSQFQRNYAGCHRTDNANHDDTADHLFFRSSVGSINLLLYICNLVGFSFRQDVFAKEHHVNDAGNSNRNTDVGIFKEAKLQLRHAGCFQSNVCQNVRRGTNQGAGTAKAGSESQLFCPPTNQAPTPREVYMQRKMSNTKFTEYFENVKKKVAWDKEDVMENDLWEFRRKCEVSYLLGIKGKIAIKDAQYPNRGIENVYFQEGIMWSIKKHYEYTKGKFSFADFIGITKMKFTGNNGSKEAFVGVGKDLLEDMMTVDYTLTKDINVKSREKWGIKFQAFESSFGTMNVVHLPILDEVGLSEIGICLDLDMLVLYKMEEERRNINMETQGEAAERNVTIQTDCLTLKGYSHLLIKPNTSGFNDAEPDLVKAKTNDGATLPSEGNKEGAILYLKKDVASTGTNDELKAGMLAQWNGTKWVKYDGDVYIGA